jgi:hypothetical protein
MWFPIFTLFDIAWESVVLWLGYWAPMLLGLACQKEYLARVSGHTIFQHCPVSTVYTTTVESGQSWMAVCPETQANSQEWTDEDNNDECISYCRGFTRMWLGTDTRLSDYITDPHRDLVIPFVTRDRHHICCYLDKIHTKYDNIIENTPLLTKTRQYYETHPYQQVTQSAITWKITPYWHVSPTLVHSEHPLPTPAAPIPSFIFNIHGWVSQNSTYCMGKSITRWSIGRVLSEEVRSMWWNKRGHWYALVWCFSIVCIQSPTRRSGLEAAVTNILYGM